MHRQIAAICVVVVLVTFSVAVGADSEIPKTIEFDGAENGGQTKDLFPAMYSGKVVFGHTQHMEEYGLECGDCHHDDTMEPIEEYDPSESYSCGDCHAEPGLVRGPIAENEVSESDLVEHKANVLHMLCIGCHEERNSKKHSVKAPVSCRTCHDKQPRSWVIK